MRTVRINSVDAEQAWLTGPAGATAATGYRAVQQDIAVTVVDWPVVHGWTEDDPDFVGAVTVLDHAGRQLATADWPAPADVSADRSLSGMGWRRGRAVGTGLAGPAGRPGDPGQVATPAGRPMTQYRAPPRCPQGPRSVKFRCRAGAAAHRVSDQPNGGEETADG